MKKYFYCSLLTLITILTTSCDSVSVLTIDVRHPARVRFPENIVNIAIVDNAGANLNDSIASAQGINEETILNSRTKRMLTESLTQFLYEENFFNDVKLFSSPVRTDTLYGTMRPLSAAQVQRISSEAEVDGIISLDLVKLRIAETNIDVNGQVILGGKAKLSLLFRIYDAEGRPLAPAMMSEDSVLWITDRDKLYETRHYNDFVLSMSEGMVRQIVPYWEQQERAMYTDATKMMKEGSKYAMAGNWKEAAIAWGTAFENENSDQKHKAKMATNIALANENLDDIENAVTWINIAKDLIKNYRNSDESAYIYWYAKKLSEREKGMNKLKEQLGTAQPTEDAKNNGEQE